MVESARRLYQTQHEERTQIALRWLRLGMAVMNRGAVHLPLVPLHVLFAREPIARDLSDTSAPPEVFSRCDPRSNLLVLTRRGGRFAFKALGEEVMPGMRITSGPEPSAVTVMRFELKPSAASAGAPQTRPPRAATARMNVRRIISSPQALTTGSIAAG